MIVSHYQYLLTQCKTTRAVVLTLGVCYYARLQNPEKRAGYVKKVSERFERPLHNVDDVLFVMEIDW